MYYNTPFIHLLTVRRPLTHVGFRNQIRTNVLVSAARHCCVCHRYKGVKVEVHHIVPTSKGGDDCEDNAIALCFDCHTDAGHYNPKHPKGTKYSPHELKEARERWYDIVRNNQIVASDFGDLLLCRYYLCKNFNAISEIAKGDFSFLPVKSPHMIRTAPGAFITTLIDSHPRSYRHNYVHGDSFTSLVDYKKEHPDARSLHEDGSQDSRFPYYEAVRTPTLEEIRNSVAGEDSITRYLLSLECPIEELSEAYTYLEECGAAMYQEIYRIRPLRFLYLSVTNISGKPLKLDKLNCVLSNVSDSQYRPFTEFSRGIETEIVMPSAPLRDGDSAILPLATILAPLDDDTVISESAIGSEIGTGEIQTIEWSNEPEAVGKYSVIGPSVFPVDIEITIGDGKRTQEIHRFNLTNLYLVDRYWECGSCPHLFFKLKNIDELKYHGELWSSHANEEGVHTFDVPENVEAIEIAELEPEKTYINSIIVNGVVNSIQLCLTQFQSIRFRVVEGDKIELVGYYEVNADEDTLKADPVTKNSVVKRYAHQSSNICFEYAPSGAGSR